MLLCTLPALWRFWTAGVEEIECPDLRSERFGMNWNTNYSADVLVWHHWLTPQTLSWDVKLIITSKRDDVWNSMLVRMSSLGTMVRRTRAFLWIISGIDIISFSWSGLMRCVVSLRFPFLTLNCWWPVDLLFSLSAQIIEDFYSGWRFPRHAWASSPYVKPATLNWVHFQFV